MDCHNCGAPVIWQWGTRQLTCDHCGSHRLLEAVDGLSDRVTPLGQSAAEECPVCHESLEQVVLDESPAAGCQTCHGLLFADAVFADLVRRRRSDFKGAESRPVPLDQRLLNRRVACPRCSIPMDVHPFYGPGQQVIDSCHRCGVIWLDAGELTAIETAPGRR
jgi:Zn-finger nucleic acid-binding protein